MKNENLFSVGLDWLDSVSNDEIDAIFPADIKIVVNGIPITRNDDTRSQSVRDSARLCAWHLAHWFASNWWRLRWEPFLEIPDTDWRLSHGLAAAGGGFIWPNAFFASIGDAVDVTVNPSQFSAQLEPIHYINKFFVTLPADSFERGVDVFLSTVCDRGEVCKAKNRLINDLWSEVIYERQNPQVATYRKLEAIAGFDPDVAPASLMEILIGSRSLFGKTAVEEVVADFRKNATDALQFIKIWSEEKHTGSQIDFPELPSQYCQNRSTITSESATRFAKELRTHWGLGEGKLSDKRLNDLVSCDIQKVQNSNLLCGETRPFAFTPAAAKSKTAQVFFPRNNKNSRRFALCRLFADRLFFANNEPLAFASDAKTFRQKFQRIFAQEFLCPTDALLDFLQNRFDEDSLDAAAEHFAVSPWVVRNALGHS